MFKKLSLAFFLLFSSFVAIYPSKKENTYLFNYCYSFEKILSRNALEKSKNVSNKVKIFTNDITIFGTNKSKGNLVNNIINQYKISKKLFIITFIPNQVYCLAGYWIEVVNPGKFASIVYEKSKQRIDEYKDIKKELDGFIKDINSEYESIKNEIIDLF